VFNLYTAGMLRLALAPICRAFGDADEAARSEAVSREIEAATVARFWSAEDRLFVANLPWIREEGGPRLCDRSLATAMLYDQCPGGDTAGCHAALRATPAHMGLCYPANAWWRYRALAEAGSIRVVLDELRARWATMPSVRLNNTLQEWWHSEPDRCHEWSHCPMAPLNLLTMCIAGITPIEPGFARTRIQPRLGDLGRIATTAWTVRGPIRFEATRCEGGHEVSLAVPADVAAEVIAARSGTPQPLAAGQTRVFVPDPGS
jgi:hypothetical protein